MKRFFFIVLFGAIIYSWFFHEPTWKQEKYDSCKEFIRAFKGVNYSEIVEHYGEPDKEFTHWNGAGCTTDFCREAVWNKLKVNGRTPSLIFNAYRFKATTVINAINVHLVDCSYE